MLRSLLLGLVTFLYVTSGYSAFKQDLPKNMPSGVRWVFERAGPCLNNNHITRISANGECLALQTYYGKTLPKPHPILIIFIHGDGIPGGGPSDYLKMQATKFSRPNIVPVVLIRPGYYDSYGHYSTGRGYGFACKGYPCDGYRPHVVNTLASAIRNLKKFYHPKCTILVGHSGGAIMSGIILGKYPHLANGAVLASVTYSVKQWSKSHKGWGVWNKSFSPNEYVGDIPKNDFIYIVSGTKDTDTWPRMARKYYRALKKRGVDAHFISVPGGTHNSVVLSNSSLFDEAINKSIDQCNESKG